MSEENTRIVFGKDLMIFEVTLKSSDEPMTIKANSCYVSNSVYVFYESDEVGDGVLRTARLKASFPIENVKCVREVY